MSVFWQQLETKMRQNTELDVNLDCTHIILGILPFKEKLHAINHCIIYAKVFIHKERNKGVIPNLKNFIMYYNHILMVEKDNYVMRGLLNDFKRIFCQLYEKL